MANIFKAMAVNRKYYLKSKLKNVINTEISYKNAGVYWLLFYFNCSLF